MFCPQCGAAHTPGGSFCGNCGTRHPFAAMAAAGPDTSARASGPGLAPRAASAHRDGTPRLQIPVYTVAGVVCAVVVGVVFALLTEFVRDNADSGVFARSAVHQDAKARRGAMETLMAVGRQGETK